MKYEKYTKKQLIQLIEYFKMVIKHEVEWGKNIIKDAEKEVLK